MRGTSIGGGDFHAITRRSDTKVSSEFESLPGAVGGDPDPPVWGQPDIPICVLHQSGIGWAAIDYKTKAWPHQKKTNLQPIKAD